MTDSERLVRVYATGNAFDGLLTKGHLEAEGITVLMKGESEGPYRAGPVYLWVTVGRRGTRAGGHPRHRVRGVRDLGRRCLGRPDEQPQR